MRSVLHIGNKIIAVVLVLLTVTAVFIPSFGLFTSLQDYLVHFLFFLIVSGLIGLVIGNDTVLFTSFGCAAMLTIFLKNASNTELKDPNINDQIRLSVAHLNLSLITDVKDVIKVLNNPDIEVVSFQEYTPDWGNIIPLISESFPYSFKAVRMDLYGKAVFSKYKIINSEILEHQGIPNIVVKVQKEENVFTIFSAYLTPALDKNSTLIARQQILDLEKSINEDKENLIVMGEFNQVYWSHDIISFRNKTSLLNSRRNVNPSTFKMPYDHIFYTPSLECYFFEDLRDTSANHIGCRGAFQLKK